MTASRYAKVVFMVSKRHPWQRLWGVVYFVSNI
jgi:hypothetical protein